MAKKIVGHVGPINIWDFDECPRCGRPFLEVLYVLEPASSFPPQKECPVHGDEY